MSSVTSTNVFVESLKGLIKHAFRLLLLGCAWSMRFIGLALSKTGETIERIIVKKSSL